MRLIIVDRATEQRRHFWPLVLSRPIWDLRCGFTSLGERLQRKIGTTDVACFLPPYMAEAWQESTTWRVNDSAALKGEDLLVVDARVKADTLDMAVGGPSEVRLDEQGELLYARVTKEDAERLQGGDIESFLASAKAGLPVVPNTLSVWEYTWDLVLANPAQITADFASAGKYGIEGTIEQPNAIRGSAKDVYIAPGVRVHPMVVIDAEHGPIYIDEGAEIHPFTRIEGPCYIGKKSILLGAKCREGNSIGPMCRIGGEVEESIIHGFSNKYHDGFLGHSYVGQWVNLGALTTNSDLKNDYSNVSVMLDGKRSIDTGSTKVGSLIGDHTKTSIGTLLNTGSYVGAMGIIMATGKPLPKFLPSFSWFIEGIVTKGFGRRSLYETAGIAMSRRGCRWTQAQEAMWEAIFELTAPTRNEAVKKGRKAMMKAQGA
jgi:UDP-N-acetylglucosamine diphosphorylase / glucose-1-phosphate thymidylyltransferase / UDP-N-acetylgalactosamine diphosphorylase / glucosamine-1-phosphate N-acetyltransferase / galactosamine-1-phosphate N-acetyltransferase